MEKDEIRQLYWQAEELCRELESARENLYVLRAERGDEAQKIGLKNLSYYKKAAVALISEIAEVAEEEYDSELMGWVTEIEEALSSFETEVYSE
ncbi:hypothetical protein P378_19930 [Desulforamulus profundi]|uniref:Uncharacterized protein n=1 Tax=Desulforamulus profundi TaxID=1383067 RepID=A0A2C6MBJ1_9FIRM|nr:hypothetical protein [Desulforamulus profundi]PHJ36865.1 hypothetical protein P378_19930 [Desulforamulus profundi]